MKGSDMTKQNEGQRRKAIERSLSGYPFPKFENLKDRANPNFSTEYSYALNYANYTFENNELKEFSQDYKDAPDLSKVPDWEFHSLGHLTWLANKGVPMDEFTTARIKDKLAKLHKKYNVETVKPRDLKRERTGEVIAELDGIVDDVVLKKPDITQPLKILQEKLGVDYEYIRAHYQSLIDEISNPELEEYFPDKKRLLAVYGIILKDVEKNESGNSFAYLLGIIDTLLPPPRGSNWKEVRKEQYRKLRNLEEKPF